MVADAFQVKLKLHFTTTLPGHQQHSRWQPTSSTVSAESFIHRYRNCMTNTWNPPETYRWWCLISRNVGCHRQHLFPWLVNSMTDFGGPHSIRLGVIVSFFGQRPKLCFHGWRQSESLAQMCIIVWWDETRYIFQNYNERDHTVKETMGFLQQHDVRTRQDLHPIEHMWNKIVKRLNDVRARSTTADELCWMFLRLWVPMVFSNRPSHAMYIWCIDVTNSRGGHIIYWLCVLMSYLFLCSGYWEHSVTFV